MKLIGLIQGMLGRSLKLAAASVVAITLAACGGGGAGGTVSGSGGGAGGGNNPPSAGDTVQRVELVASTPQVQTGSTAQVVLTVTAVGTNNIALRNAPITLASSSGALSFSGTPITDANGKFSFNLDIGAEKNNRTITVSATIGTLTATSAVVVSGTRLAISGPNSAILGTSGPLNYDVTLQDGLNNRLANQRVTFTSSLGNQFVGGNTVTTDAAGTARIAMNVTIAGNDSITASSNGATANTGLVISSNSIRVTSSSPQFDISNASQVKRFTVAYLSNNAPRVGLSVRGTVDRGSITSATTAVTDANGQVSFDVNSTSVGSVTFTATSADGISASGTAIYVTSAIDNFSIQANPRNIGRNSDGSSAQQAAISVRVLDATLNPVADARVDYTIITDRTNGRLSAPSASTDGTGTALTNFIPGNAGSANDEVVISAVVTKGGRALGAQQARLTVGGESLYISIETNNLINVPDPLLYQKDFAISVTDSNGSPVRDAIVSASVVPIRYFKGFLSFDGLVWDYDLASGTPLSCLNEDANNNGIIEPGEDFNENGTLEPRQVTPISLSNQGRTDPRGFVTASVTYAKNFSKWVEVEIRVRVQVGGSEGSATRVYRLTGATGDYNNRTVSPPGIVSPFGFVTTATPLTKFGRTQGAGCANPN